MRNIKTDEACGTCHYHKLETTDGGYVCTNSESDYCSYWTEYGDSCENWEERE